jgi:DnaJ-related protein SCJ1
VVTTKCTTCGGRKVIHGTDDITIEVEPGMDTGHEIVFPRAGDQSSDIDVTPGDVIYRIVTSPHSRFTRRGDDLYMTVPITLKEAIAGFAKKFKVRAPRPSMAASPVHRPQWGAARTCGHAARRAARGSSGPAARARVCSGQHLDGHEVTVKRTKVTQPNFVLKIAGEGMPQHNFPSVKGDLYCEFTVVIPTKLTKAQKDGISDLLTTPTPEGHAEL